MGRHKKIVAEAVAPAAPEPEPVKPEGAEEFAGVYPTAKVMVWERTRDKPDALIGVYDADGEVQNRVAEQIGGGDFLWRIRLANGQWASFEKHGIIPRGRFSISERSFPKVKPALAVAAPVAPVAPAEPPMNMQTMMMAMMQQQTTLLTALIARPGPDPIAMMSAFHQMMPQVAPSGNGLESINAAMDLMTKAQDLIPQGKSGGGGKMEDRIFGLLESVAPVIANRMMAPTPAPFPAPRPAPAPPLDPQLAVAPVAEIVEPPIEENPPEVGDVNLKKSIQHAMIGPYLVKLVQLAEKNADPEVYANVFLDEAEDRGLTPERIREFFINEKLVAELGETFPGVEKNADWFGEFRSNVLGMLTPIGKADTLSGDAEPSPSDAPTNSDA